MNQKIENLLNLSLNSSVEERAKSLNLDTAYEEPGLLEVIVKYNGSTSRLRANGYIVEELINGYAIISLPPAEIENLVGFEEIEYIEMPKTLYFQTLEGKRDSCITQVVDRSPFLDGKGVLIAFLDSGIDYVNQVFRNPDGSTRLVSIWDQTMKVDSERGFFPPLGFRDGVELTEQQINLLLENPIPGVRQPAYDTSGHGTAVAAIAAAGLTNENPGFSGVAPKSSLLFVKLGNSVNSGFPRTTELMRAVTYALNVSRQKKLPLVINISLGYTYGSHEGTSLLERFLDNASEIGRTSIVIASGNEGAAAGHYSGALGANPVTVEMSVAEYERNLNVQLWKSYRNDIGLKIISPNGEQYEIPTQQIGIYRKQLQNTQLLIYSGEPLPYAARQEIYIDMIPISLYVDSGVWQLQIINQGQDTGEFDLFLPSSTVLNAGTGFYQSNPYGTFTIPSTASQVISVGAYDSRFFSYAAFSGRGVVYTSEVNVRLLGDYVKPELVAPGVDIETVSARGGFIRVSGTSFAAPFVSGSAALMMEWGIVRNNDPYLYGDKLKAFLIKGARPFPGQVTPNEKTGWGALCVNASLPI